jgi:ribosomal protein L11 methyltransferase
LSWAELELVVPRRRLDHLSSILFDLGTLGLQEDHLPGEAPPVRQPWDEGPQPPEPDRIVVRAWWDAAGFEQARERVAAELAGWEDAGEPRWSTLADGGWEEAWRTHCKPVRVADDLVIAPPWCARPGDLVLEPGMAFGSGEHPTTRACLEVIAQRAQPGERCLDVGTGSGILAIAAAHRGMVVWGIDTDPQAVRAARENAETNGLDVRVDDTPLSRVSGTHELVVANLYAEVLIALAPDLIRVCGGRLAVAGVLHEKADAVEEALAELELVARVRSGDWVSMELRT